MERKEAIKYLEKKDVATTEEEISKVMNKGKIYGDPLVELD